MLRSLIARSALGRVGKIGALYDVRSEGFVGDSLFSSELEEDDVDITDLNDSSIDLVMEDNMQEKYNKLNVELDVQLSLLAGLVKLDETSASGAFLREEKQSAGTLCMSLVYQLKTIQEEINPKHHRKNIDMDILSPSDGESRATHVVIGIDWGAVCSITCQYENREEKNTHEVKGDLSVELGKIKSLLDDKGSIKNTSDENHGKFTFRCSSDVSPPDRDLPVTFEGVVELARSLPSLIKHTHNERGVPLLYTLMPLNDVAKICKPQIQLHIQYKTIGEGIIKKCAHIMEGITTMRQTLYDLQSDMHTGAEYVDTKSLDKIDGAVNDFTVEECRFKDTLRDRVGRARSGQEDVPTIDELLSNELPAILSTSTYDDHIRAFDTDLMRIKSIKSWKRNGITYIGKTDKFTVNSSKKVYVLYKSSKENVAGNDDFNKKNLDYFLKLQTAYAHDSEYEFIIVDQNTRLDLWPTRSVKSVIHSFDHGAQSSIDEVGDFDMCLILIKTPTCITTRPTDLAPVHLPCPKAVSGRGKCKNDKIQWKCSKCRQIVTYSFKTKLVYCDCGKSDPTNALWRCKGEYHGMSYVRYPEDVLAVELSYQRKMINIVILGETGVGKSTWINSFYNYLCFADMKDALNDNKFLIPSSMTYIDDNGAEQRIQIGNFSAKDDRCNESEGIGEAATQNPCTHVFYIDDYVVRLIDTPGIGDPRGLDKDKENFENILGQLTYYDDIHAVCILLKPNIARLTPSFRFCIRELLSHLSSSVKDNIAFCFTHARSTSYRPGETLPILNRELQTMGVGIQATPSNYFCFDSESFRFLTFIRDGNKFTKEDEEINTKSWKQSVEETRRLFNHISILKPHNTRTTLNVNDARRIITYFDRPLGEVAKMIQHNIQQGSIAKHKVKCKEMDIKSLQAVLHFSGYELEHVPGNIRIACTHSNCAEDVSVGENRVTYTVYNKVCQKACVILTPTFSQNTNNEKLKHCWFVKKFGLFGNVECTQCYHHWNVHRYITFTTKIVSREFLSEEVQMKINNQSDSVEKMKAAIIDEIDKKNTELQLEKTTIIRTAAQFRAYLNANALVAQNDALDDYIDMIIHTEKDKPHDERNLELIETTEKMREQYTTEKEKLDKATGTNTDINISPVDIKNLQRELFELKHMGPTLKKFFDEVSTDRAAEKLGCTEKIAPISEYKGTVLK